MLLIIVIIPVLNLLTPGIFLGHDTALHVARLGSFVTSLQEGILIPRWGGTLNYGYGHPALLFYYPLPSYIGYLFYLIGFSLIDTTKLMFALGYIGSAVGFFVWAKKPFGIYCAFVGAVLYSFAPYRFVDLYVRGALGEHLSFMIIPFVLFSVRKFFEVKNLFWSSILSISIASLITIHTLVIIMMLPIILVYGLAIGRISRVHYLTILLFLYSIIMGFLLSSFYIFPAFFEGKYTLRNIVNRDSVIDRFVVLPQLIYSAWNFGSGSEFTKMLGFPQLISICGLLFVALRKGKYRKQAIMLLVSIITFIYFMLPYSSFFWQNIQLLRSFQFPWRFLTMTTLGSAVAGVLVLYSYPRIQMKLGITLVILSIIFTSQMWRAREYSWQSDDKYKSEYVGTTDSSGENSPIWSIRSMESKPKNKVEFTAGSGTIQVRVWKSTVHQYDIYSDNTAQIVDNTLYFPGWNVYVNNTKVPIEYQNPDLRGLLTYSVSKGFNTVRVEFADTKIRQISNWLSFFSIIIVLVTMLIGNRIRYDSKNR